MKLKACPLLVQSNTCPSLTVDGEAYTRTFFLECLGLKCAAFIGGNCAKFENVVRLPEPPKEEKE